MGFKRCGNVENRASVSIYRFENLTATLTLRPARARAGSGRTEATARRDVGHVHHMPRYTGITVCCTYSMMCVEFYVPFFCGVFAVCSGRRTSRAAPPYLLASSICKVRIEHSVC